ncbi:hypothetical protein Pan258_17200 [Symmachiella dynata]|nr:hypothetical protein Pan258_17200 [Symmachiella dynata]
MSTYVLVAILRRELRIERTMSEILQILSITIFEKTPIKTVLNEIQFQSQILQNHKQLSLFDL